jgi:hypothetical protein
MSLTPGAEACATSRLPATVGHQPNGCREGGVPVGQAARSYLAVPSFVPSSRPEPTGAGRSPP